MFRSFETRSHELERLDTGDYTDQEYALWQKEAKWVNHWLGDTRALRLSLSGIKMETISVLDVGAGSGELLAAAKSIMGSRCGDCVGAELNADAARSIADRPGMEGVQCDALKLPFEDASFDVVISSLFMHHLDDEQAVTLIREMSRVARCRFFVIDLHRHPAAYGLYRTFSPIFLQRFTVEDGSLSILKGFRTDELYELASRAGVGHATVTRRAPFRLVLSGPGTRSE